jgi:hypothetical protein
MKSLGFGLLCISLVACVRAAPGAYPAPDAVPPLAASTAIQQTFPTRVPFLVPHNPGVADLLRERPAPGKVIEVDAYYSGAGARRVRSGPYVPLDQLICPGSGVLTDLPFVSELRILNGTEGNSLPHDTPILIAAIPEATRPPGARILPDLPYHARFRGYLGEPAFADCANADHIFVVQEVVVIYTAQPSEPSGEPLRFPDDFATWQYYHNAAMGYSVPHPPDWRADWLDDVTSALRAPQWLRYPVILRIHPDEMHLDPYSRTSIPLPMQGRSFGLYSQSWLGDQAHIASQRLNGYVSHKSGADEREVTVLFSGKGRTYEISLRYPTGFDASQQLLTIYSAIVYGFRLDVVPEPSPTLPIKQTLGTGSFLSQEEALTRLREHRGTNITLLDALLVSEATTRRQATACGNFQSHPDGVWMLVVQETLSGTAHTTRFFIDATTGKPLCGEGIHPRVTPYPSP